MEDLRNVRRLMRKWHRWIGLVAAVFFIVTAFTGIWLEAQPAMLKSRVFNRRNDASDATAEVIDAQLGYDLGRMTWERVDASGAFEQTLACVRQKLPLPPPVRA